jgi:hypothetical protein
MIKFLRQVSQETLVDLAYSPEYSEYIMKNGDNGERAICNGNTLLEAMEDGYLFTEFLKSKGIDPVAREDEVFSPYLGV